MASLFPTSTLNPNNVHGGAFPTDKTGGVANSSNTQYGATGGSAAALRGGNLYSISGSGGSPSAVQEPMKGSCGVMKGGAGSRRRKHTRKHKRSRSRSSSKKYGRKRSLKYRMKHRRSRSRSHHNKRSSQSGGYHQYMGNTPFTLGYRIPGINLSSNMSALANPAPFMPYNNYGK
jgi:hypothetical protein